MKPFVKRRVSELSVDPQVKEALMRVLGPEEEVYVEFMGDRIRIIL